MSGFMFQSEHERNRSNATGSLVSTDLHDIPKVMIYITEMY